MGDTVTAACVQVYVCAGEAACRLKAHEGWCMRTDTRVYGCCSAQLLLALLLAVTVQLQLWLAAHCARIGGQALLAMQGAHSVVGYYRMPS